jgi:hypothetical protein
MYSIVLMHSTEAAVVAIKQFHDLQSSICKLF